MSGLDKNLSFGKSLPPVNNQNKKNKEILNKPIEKEIGQNEQLSNAAIELKNTQAQSLANTNSNIPLNQSLLTSPALNQSSLNSANIPKQNLSNLNDTNTGKNILSTPSQLEYGGPSDLPAYAGIANMSLKSWIANNSTSNKPFSNNENDLTVLLDSVQGFQDSDYEEPDENESKNPSKNRKRNLLLLSHLFGCREQTSLQDTDLKVKFFSFKKLGSEAYSEDNESLTDFKSTPPFPALAEVDDSSNIKPSYLYELFALPKEFPECLRLFANEKIILDKNYIDSFLQKRLGILQSKTFEGNKDVGNLIKAFVPLLNQNEYPLLLPFILLYYPLPIPYINNKFDFGSYWIKDEKKKTESDIIASCEIYYFSKKRGRFLIRFELDNKNKISFKVQADEKNNGIVKDMEIAVAQAMLVLQNPPALDRLNVLLTREIYNATDLDEELSIVSTGPLRLEIVLASYTVLLLLNKLSEESDPAGLIEMD